MRLYSLGGFLSYQRFLSYLQPPFSPLSQDPEPSSEDFYFVGSSQNFGSFSPTPAPFSKGTPPAISAAGSKKNDIDDDNDVEVDRSATHDEVRLASAWLNHSTDPIDGYGLWQEE
ncbi:hypothetical protein Zm00014a_015600 [Zea mays]|uniref:Uncharacterized protein n=1 Tax=Zea mays TaxID=4577 RepID=A0A3L6DP78_MAIZE|nr:hypothetical protein Zm00014a_015600 [Zea mays]